jgi:hypothetical protein
VGNRSSQKEKQMKEKRKNGAHFEGRRTNAKRYGSA